MASHAACSLLVEQNGLIYTSVWFSVSLTSSHDHGNVQKGGNVSETAVETCMFLSFVRLMCSSHQGFWKVHASFAQEYPQPFHAALHTPPPTHPPQRHKSTIRRVPTQSALLFSPATPLRPASCKSSTANWQVRGTQQPRSQHIPQHQTETCTTQVWLPPGFWKTYFIISCHKSLQFCFIHFY